MPKFDYDILIIGGGAAGLTSSGICASFGAKTTLVEKDRLGGDCTWTGCIPSKSLLHVAKQVARIRKAESLGVTCRGVNIDFNAVMHSVRATRQRIYEDADSPELMQQRGVEVLTGHAAFQDPHSISLTDSKGSRTVTFRSAIITAGGSPLVPPIAGLDKLDSLTNETIFELTQQPEHLAILGSGPIGIEMAQSFRLLGSKVTVIALDERILIRDEPQCTKILKSQLEKAGIDFFLEQTIHSVNRNGNYDLQVGPEAGAEKTITCDALLVAVGRRPNLSELKLENAGVRFENSGIPVDRFCRTNVKHIFAAGDVTTFLKFTHVAENMAKTAAVNAVVRLPLYRHEREVIPWVTYTDPECAHVGQTAQELENAGTKFDTIEFPYSKIDRAVTEHEDEGLILVHTSSRGKILGAHVVGAQAGEIINEYALAMRHRLKLSKISGAVHAYPTMLLGARRAADQYYVRLQKRWMSKLVRSFFRYRGEIPKYVGRGDIL